MKVSRTIGVIAGLLLVIIVGSVFFLDWSPMLQNTSPITVEDYEGRTVTLDGPAERVVSLVPSALRIITQIDGSQKVVGMDRKALQSEPAILPILAHPEYLDLPNVGDRKEPNIEVLMSLDLDVVFTTQSADNADTLQQQLGVPVICVLSLPEADYELFRLVGKVIGKTDEAESVVSFLQEQTRRITSVTDDISDDLPTVYLGLWTNEKMITNTMPSYQGVEPEGGINVAADTAPTTFWGSAEISKEQVIAWNPDVRCDRSESDLLRGAGKMISENVKAVLLLIITGVGLLLTPNVVRNIVIDVIGIILVLAGFHYYIKYSFFRGK